MSKHAEREDKQLQFMYEHGYIIGLKLHINSLLLLFFFIVYDVLILNWKLLLLASKASYSFMTLCLDMYMS